MWQRSIASVSTEADLEALLLDSTVVRAHQHTAGALKKAGPQALGRSRGGLSTTIHTTVDALDNPVRGLLTGGAGAARTQAQARIEGLPTQAGIGDKGDEAEALIARIQAAGAQAVLPPRSNRIEQRAYD